MAKNNPLIPIYTTQGDVAAFLQYPHVFNRQGEWIGWVTAERQVYSVHGHYVGYLSDDPRVLRKESSGYLKPHQDAPIPPQNISTPSSVPLAPMMPEISIGTFDVLADRPELMPSVDFGDLREDMD
jgi:hypothetical protein